MCFVLRQTQRDNESPHPWDLAGHERVVGGVDKHPSPNAPGSYPKSQGLPHMKECCARYFGKH